MSEAFAEAASAALLVMVSQQTTETPAANSYRLEGARQFLGILSNLTTERKETRIEEQNLTTNV